MKSEDINSDGTDVARDADAFTQIFKKHRPPRKAVRSGGFNVMALGYRGTLIIVAAMISWAMFDWLVFGWRLDLPFWLEQVAGMLGLAGTFKFAEGAFITARRARALFKPFSADWPSNQTETAEALIAIRNLLLGASDAAVRGTICFLIAYLMVLCKPAVESFSHKSVSPQSQSQPHDRKVQPAQDAASQADAPALAPRCSGSSCSH